MANDPSTHGDVESFGDFKAKEERELANPDPTKQQLLKCIAMAEYRLDNNKSTKELNDGIERMLRDIRSKG